MVAKSKTKSKTKKTVVKSKKPIKKKLAVRAAASSSKGKVSRAAAKSKRNKPLVKPKRVAPAKLTIKKNIVRSKPAAMQAKVSIVMSAKTLTASFPRSEIRTVARPVAKSAAPRPASASKPAHKKNAPSHKPADRRSARKRRSLPQYAYMKAPGLEHVFEVGDTVEVFCDHEKSGERVRGWIKGIVVQVDHKMVAVQFRSNVFLTDGWMVPDRILWYPLSSEHIRPFGTRKPAKELAFPDY